MPSLRLRLLAVLVVLIACSISAAAQAVLQTLPVDADPNAIAINPGTNRIYVGNAGSVSVIDGASNTVIARVGITGSADGAAVNTVTNKVYVSEFGGFTCANCLAVIDGASNTLIREVPVGNNPVTVAVNSVTNKIYVTNYSDNTVTVIDGVTNNATTVAVGRAPTAIAINSATNKIYVTDQRSFDVAVIDGATNSVSTVPVGIFPSTVAVNAVTNQIYVGNLFDNTVSVIDGATNNVTPVTIGGQFPSGIGIDTTRNKIYVVVACTTVTGACNSRGEIAVIDGATNNVSTINNIPSYDISGCDSVLFFASCPTVVVDGPNNDLYISGGLLQDGFPYVLTTIDLSSGKALTTGLGDGPSGIVLNPNNGRLYIPNNGDATVSIADPNAKLQFVPVAPCRVVDTRMQDGTFGGPAIQGGAAPREFPLPQGTCNIPSTAVAYSLNATVVPHGPLGYLTLLPSSQLVPNTSTLNSLDGRLKAEAAIIQGGVDAGISAYASNTTDLILDINGYFIPESSSTLAFFPLSPCRVADTRKANGELGGPALAAGVARSFPIPDALACDIPSAAQAYSLNVTVVPQTELAYLIVWPTGQSRPLVSTLNDTTGTVVANAAIVPAGTGGAISVYPSNNTNLVIDINGYFAPANSGPNPLSLYTLHSCRVLDTRDGRGGEFSGTLVVDVQQGSSSCGVSDQAKGYGFNATVIPTTGYLGYLTLWPDGENMPGVSTLNALDGAITSNMAIVQTSNGLIDAYSSNLTQMLLDISGYFAP